MIASVVLVFLWGLISPRNQWKVLVAWSYRKPEANEPSAFAFGVQRFICAFGVLFFIVLGAGTLKQYVDNLPPPAPPQTALQQMWGVAPVPQVVDRIVRESDVVPTGLVEVPVQGYQIVDNATREPDYLFLLTRFNSGQWRDVGGIVGIKPAKDFVALNSAELVVSVRTWSECIPRKAVVIETETSVQVAVYVGLPDRADDLLVDHLRCDRPAFVQNSLLIPIDLTEAVGDRAVETVDGTAITRVDVVSK